MKTQLFHWFSHQANTAVILFPRPHLRVSRAGLSAFQNLDANSFAYGLTFYFWRLLQLCAHYPAMVGPSKVKIAYYVSTRHPGATHFHCSLLVPSARYETEATIFMTRSAGGHKWPRRPYSPVPTPFYLTISEKGLHTRSLSLLTWID